MVATFDEQKRPRIYFYIFSVLFVGQNIAEFHCFNDCSISETLWFNAHAQRVPVLPVSSQQLIEILSVTGMLCSHHFQSLKWFCKNRHAKWERGIKRRRISDSWERLYCFLLCQGRITASAHWNSVRVGFLPICNSQFK